MFGPSIYAITQLHAACIKPPSLKCIFALWGQSDFYRDSLYHGGISQWSFFAELGKIASSKMNPAPHQYLEKYGEKKFEEAIAAALADPEIAAVPYYREILTTRQGPLDPILFNLDSEYWRTKSVSYANTEIPAYLGGCWGAYFGHTPGGFRSWEAWKGPKKMLVGPPIYMDRPVYQCAYESLRWFDYWLKGIQNGVMDEPPVRLFIVNTGEWKETTEWPVPGTRWTPFYLHENGLLSEHEFWPNEGFTTFEDSHTNRGSVTFRTPAMVENTEVCGPIALNLYGSTTDTEVLWFVSLLDIDPDGNEKLLTRGWLRGSQRAIDPAKSKPWAPHQTHVKREPLTPNEIYEFNIGINAYGILFGQGHRIGLRVKCVDDEVPASALEGFAMGHLWRQNASRVTVHHNENYPSHLLLPITKGNLLEMFIAGGVQPKEWFPYRRI
jgi:hypothetical protein